jgi:hypothetical protein
VTIGAAVTSVGNQAFGYCTRLDTVIFETGSDILSAWNDNAFSIDTDTYSGTSLWSAYSAATPKAGTYTLDTDENTWSKSP